jgi:hypothetical protein
MRRFLTIASLVIATVSTVFANNASASLGAEDALPSLKWKGGPIRIAVSTSLLRESSNIKRESDVIGAIRRSIETWAGAANIEFQLTSSDKQSASPAGIAGDGISLITIAQTSENVLLFARDPENAAATTRVFYGRRGAISEADIVLNPYQQFSTDGTMGTFDLESTLTHEIGHLLGLPHSSVLGSTMNANYGRNGVFGLQNFSSRTLSADDVAAARAIYGMRGASEECCGLLEGQIVAGKVARTFDVWLEDSSGRVAAATRTTNGGFNFDGLNAGKYLAYAQEVGRAKNSMPVRELGEITIANGETTVLNSKLAPAGVRDFELSYLGFNGQLSEMAVSLSPGRPYTIYLGGKNLDPKKLSISFTSPFLSVVPGSARSLDYGDEVSVVSVEIKVSPRAPKGEYAIVAESDRGDRRALIGGLTIDSFTNPWSSFGTLEE